MKKKLLTKSKFKIALECPTKLFYMDKEEYLDNSLKNSFLKAIADGGEQVGAMAKCYYPEGIEITEIDPEKAIAKTEALLNEKEITLFEAAIEFENLLIRADILIKKGDNFELIEVKSKAINGIKIESEMGIGCNIKSKWKPYIKDVAFQRYVLKKRFPNSSIKSYLLLPDKLKKATVGGLNSFFNITKNKKGKTIIELKGDCNKKNIGEPILKKINVDEKCNTIEENEYVYNETKYSFENYIKTIARNYYNSEKMVSKIGKKCKECPFRISTENIEKGYKSGFNECWLKQTTLTKKNLQEPMVWDIWNFQGSNKLFETKRFLMRDIDITTDLPKGVYYERQKVQIEKVINNDDSIEFQQGSFLKEQKEWKYPLHFIDFETAQSPIPFYKDANPFQQIAFQYSHHIYHQNGKIEHKSEFIEVKRDHFPNFNFVRSLKKDLENDNGTIFRYANHEDSILKTISSQLETSEERDKEKLIKWIATIRKGGDRCMVDQCELVKKFYYNPKTGGSNSLKAVLPAVLNSSNFLQKKYGKAIYGTNKIKSLNFYRKKWLVREGDAIVNPYKTLKPIKSRGKKGFSINEGSAALGAWNSLQAFDGGERHIRAVKKALLRYCELDTLAMVMIHQHWMEDF